MERFQDRYESIDNLMKAQTAVSENLSGACKIVVRSWRSSKVLVNVYDASVRLVVLGLALTWLLPNAFQSYSTAATRSFSNDLPSSPVWATVFAAVSAVAWVLVTFAPLDYLIKHFPNKRPAFVLAQSLIIVPVSFVLVEWTLNHLSGSGSAYSSISALARYCLGLTFSFNILVLLVVGPVVAVVFLAPPSLVLVISNRIPLNLPWTLSSHDALVRRVVEESFPTTRSWSEATARRVSSLVRKKTEGQLAQIQAVTPALGVLGLLALLSLVLPSEQIQAAMESLNRFLTEPTGTAGAPLQTVTSLTLFAIVVFGLVFFLHAYWILRVLEIVDVLCAIKLEEHERARESSPVPSVNDTEDGAAPPLHRFLASLFRMP